MMKNNFIYEGTVRHRRFTPFNRTFKYKIFMTFFDINHIEKMFKKSIFWNINKKALISEICFNFRSKRNFKKMLELHCNNPRPLAWGYQWQFNCLNNKALAITPSANMSLNIGFERNDSTNTFGQNPIASKLQDCDFPLSHPKEIIADLQYDRAVSNTLCPSDWSILRGKVRNKFSKFIKI